MASLTPRAAGTSTLSRVGYCGPADFLASAGGAWTLLDIITPFRPYFGYLNLVSRAPLLEKL